MLADSLTHKDLARLAGVSETSIKSYRRKFPGFIPVAGFGKPIRFLPEAGPVCQRIRECFRQGLSVEETRKRLAAEFPERADARSVSLNAPRRAGEAPVQPEALERFLQSAGQVLQAVAALAGAQTRADERLDRLEQALGRLAAAGLKNEALIARLVEGLGERLAPQPTPQPQPAPEGGLAPGPGVRPEETPAEDQAQRVTVRKIVTVRDKQGRIESYALGEGAKRPLVPPEGLLDLPVVIRSERGEYLGLPGRLTLRDFVQFLEAQGRGTGLVLIDWRGQDGEWIFTMHQRGGPKQDLHFAETTTPKGNLVALLSRLDVNGKETTQAYLQEFFRQQRPVSTSPGAAH
jgi:hypothetical protein